MSIDKKLFEINLILSRVLGQKASLAVSLRVNEEGKLMISNFGIKNSKGELITTKVSNTIIHNIVSSIEDSKHHGKHWKVLTDPFGVVFNNNVGVNLCMLSIKKEIQTVERLVKKCRDDVNRLADKFGAATIQHVLDNRA